MTVREWSYFIFYSAFLTCETEHRNSSATTVRSVTPHANGLTPADSTMAAGASDNNHRKPVITKRRTVQFATSSSSVYLRTSQLSCKWAWNIPETAQKQFCLLCCVSVRTPAMKLKQNYFHFRLVSISFRCKSGFSFGHGLDVYCLDLIGWCTAV